MDESSFNPFFEDAFVDRPDNLPGVASVHSEAFRQIRGLAERFYGRSEEPQLKQGRLVRLIAPEAGYGKSHLLARLRDSVSGRSLTLRLSFDRPKPIHWSTILASLLKQFRTSSPSAEFSAFERFSRAFLTRLIFDAADTQPRLLNGCPVDPHYLRTEYASLLSPTGDQKLLGWLEKRVNEIGRNASAAFLSHWGLEATDPEFWARLFLDFNREGESKFTYLTDLSEGDAKDRLLQLLRIATANQAALLIVDGLDSFFGSDSAGIMIAEIVDSIRECVPRSTTILSVNEDLWRSTFSEHLPLALRDRLENETVSLHSLDAETAKELLLFRLRPIAIQDETALRFVKLVSIKHRWKEGDYPLSPRRALREARILWTKEIESEPPGPQREEMTPGRHHAGPPPLPPRQNSESGGIGGTGTQNPAQASNHEAEADFTGIDSIINDIRGSGKAVMSERNDRPFPSDTISGATPFSEQASNDLSEFPAHPTPVDFTSRGFPSEAMGFGAPPSSSSESDLKFRSSENEIGEQASDFQRATSPIVTASPAPRLPLSRNEFTEIIHRRESDLLKTPALAMDLTRIGNFIRRVGSQHTALAQDEERYAGSLSTCLHWKVRELSVIIGFESPRNIYFWNNLLQRSLASSRIEKLTAFSHPSDPFDPTLFARFGFSPAVVRARVDIIEMNDRELAMIYATEESLNQFGNTPDAERAMQLATLHLDPLWRRMIQSL